jgi:hypothetical protein
LHRGQPVLREQVSRRQVQVVPAESWAYCGFDGTATAGCLRGNPSAPVSDETLLTRSQARG